MKKLLGVFLLVVFTAFLAGTVSANEWYTVQVTGGAVTANANGVTALPGTVPTTPAVPLDPLYAPFVTGTTPANSQLGSLPAGSWNAAGWWEFAVTGSSGSGWNNVFGGGNYTFTSVWDGPDLFDPYFADINMTFDNIYGKWSMNNPSVWTYFGLYTAPNTAGASTVGNPPAQVIGVFAFVADDPLTSPPPGFPALADLYPLTATNPMVISGGTGRFEATRVPEPASMLLLGLGLMGVAGIRRKFRS